MRILSITAQKPDSTGSGVYLASMVRAFAEAGHEQAVVCGAAPGDDPAASLPAGVRVHDVRFEVPELPFRIAGMSDDMPYPSTRYCDFAPEMLAAFKAAFARTVARVVDEFEPDVVICHHLYLVTAVAAHLLRGEGSVGGGAAASCAEGSAVEGGAAGAMPAAVAECAAGRGEAGVRRARRPRAVVGICHGTDLRQLGKHDLDGAYVREGARLLDRVFALTDAQVPRIVELLGVDSARVSVLGTGYDARTFRLPRFPKPKRKTLVYVGKIANQKGVPQLLRAIDALSADYDDTRAVLVGGGNGGPEHKAIEAQAAASRHEVVLAGKVGQGELVQAYQQAHVFVLPSFYEGLPLVLAEALACGCAVVCTDLPGVRDWLLGAVPDAPAVFVEPPRMHDVDVPYAEDLPRFEADLAAAIDRAFSLAEGVSARLRAGEAPCAVGDVSWESLCRRLAAAL